MYFYIKKEIPSVFQIDEKLDEKSNQIGQTWSDCENGAWLLLSEAQVAFRDANPGKSKKEVFDMQLSPVPERTLADIIREKITAIDMYDNSEEVNKFTVSGAPCWITAQDRAIYNSSITAAEEFNETEIELPLAGRFLTLPVAMAKNILAQVQRYADRAAIVTAKHKYGVSQLQTIEDVDAYDYKTGYPEVLTFELQGENQTTEDTEKENDQTTEGTEDTE
jgi:hypothetical protein